MAENSKISWTTHTFNPWRGCSKVSAGCANCYADTLSKRNPGTLGVWGPNGTRVVASESMWRQPLKWDREAKKVFDFYNCGGGKDKPPYQRPRVFCASLADVFEDWQGPIRQASSLAHFGQDVCVCHECGKWMPFTSYCDCSGTRTDRLPRRLTMHDVRRRLFRLIHDTPNLDWLLLTKRPENITRFIADVMNFAWGVPQVESPFAVWMEGWLTHLKKPRNVWIGTSVENQATADERIPHLLQVPAAVRFLSMEPLLGPVDLTRIVTKPSTPQQRERGKPDVSFDAIGRGWFGGAGDPARIGWVICGGESGPGARPLHPDWARSLRDQCQAAGVPFHFKQWGEWWPFDDQSKADQDAVRGCDVMHFDPLDVVGSGWYSGWASSQYGWQHVARVGKAAAGRMLDGQTWDELPTPGN
jgi:protein gp37